MFLASDLALSVGDAQVNMDGAAACLGHRPLDKQKAWQRAKRLQRPQLSAWQHGNNWLRGGGLQAGSHEQQDNASPKYLSSRLDVAKTSSTAFRFIARPLFLFALCLRWTGTAKCRDE